MTVLSCLVMFVGMAALVGRGPWVLAPLVPGVVLLWRTPLSRAPFSLGSVEPKPHIAPWEQDAQRREPYRRRNKRHKCR